MRGRGVRRPTNRSMKEPGNDPTEDCVAQYYKPCGTRSGRGSLGRGLRRHEMPTRKRVRNETPSSMEEKDRPGRRS